MNHMPSPVPPLQDALRVNRAVLADPNAAASLQQDLGLIHVEELRTYFLPYAKKDPTVGELRLLDRIYGYRRQIARPAATDLITDSPRMMQVWADVMDKHHRLGNQETRPLALTDMLTIPEAYMHRTLRPVPVHLRVTADDEGAARALADGRILSVRTEDGGLRVFTHPSIPRRRPLPKANDLLMLVPSMPLDASTAYSEAIGSIPVVEAYPIQSLTPLVHVLSQFNGADINLDRLVPPHQIDGQGHPISPITDLFERYQPAQQGFVHMILRIPCGEARTAITALQAVGQAATVFGQIRKKAGIRMMSGPTLLADLSPAALACDTVWQGVSLTCCMKGGEANVSLIPEEISPVYLPEADACLATVRMEATVSSATGDSLLVGASTAAEKAVRALTDRGASLASVALSVRISAPSHALALEVMAGLYFAAAEHAVPMPYPAVNVSASMGHTVSLQVVAYTPVTPVKGEA